MTGPDETKETTMPSRERLVRVEAVRDDLLPAVITRAELVPVLRAVPTILTTEHVDPWALERRFRRRRRIALAGLAAASLLALMWAGLIVAGASPSVVWSALSALDWRVGAGLLGAAAVAAVVARFWPRRCPGVVVHCERHR